jgi:hypothetical protein
MKNIWILNFLFLFAHQSIMAQRNQAGANYTYEVSCLGTEMDGSITLESYGMGRNYSDASEQAKKNAVSAVIFKGIKIGVGDCNKSPLLLTPNAEKKYEDYFASFFADNGPYMAYVSLKDEKILNKPKRNAKKSNQMQQRMVVVRVNRLALKKKLESDNIN